MPAKRTRSVLPAIARHFAGKSPVVRAIYDRLLQSAADLGPLEVEPKKTSIHLVRRTAFAGVATRKNALILTLKATIDIDSPRIRKREQASANRWYVYVPLTSPDDVDRELVRWLAASYAIAQ